MVWKVGKHILRTFFKWGVEYQIYQCDWMILKSPLASIDRSMKQSFYYPVCSMVLIYLPAFG